MFLLIQEILQHQAILQYVRRGKVKEVHDFGNERGEIMEIEILPTTKFL